MPAEEARASTTPSSSLPEGRPPRSRARLPPGRIVIAADGGVDRALALGLHVDRRDRRLRLRHRERARGRRGGGGARRAAPGRKDATDLELALDAAHRARRRRGSSWSARPAAGSTTSSDRFCCSARERYAGVDDRRPPRRAAVAHRPRHADARGAPGELVSLLPLHGPAEGVTTEGPRLPAPGETLDCRARAAASRTSSPTPTARVAVEHGCLAAVRPGPREEPLRDDLAHRPPSRSRRRSSRWPRGCGGDEAATPTEVVLVTHDSFAIPKPVKAAFEQESGLKLRILQGGDAGEAVNRALLTKGNPQGDVLFGIDNNLLSRALDEGLFEPYAATGLDRVDDALPARPDAPRDPGRPRRRLPQRRQEAGSRRTASRRPTALEDLTKPALPQAARRREPGHLDARASRSCSPRWRGSARAAGRTTGSELRANGVLVVDGWEEAYTTRFSGAGGSKGTRRSSSPTRRARRRR